MFCYKMIEKAAKFNEDWYDWDDKKLFDFIDKNSGNNYVSVKYMYYDLGEDENWLKRQIKDLEGDMMTVKREILLEWTFASSQSIFDEDQLDILNSNIKPIKNSIYIDNYKIDIIEDFNNLQGKNWCLSCDIGTGVGRDYSTFSLIDPSTFKQVMKFKNNLISPLNFADLIIKFVSKYAPNSVIIPEDNAPGVVFIEYIERSPVSKNLYYRSSKDPDPSIKVIKEESIFKKKTKLKLNKSETRKFGFHTGKQERHTMTEDILFMIANERPELCNNEELFNEMKKLIRTRTGRIDHRTGEHDDLIMSYLIGLYVLIHSTNRNKFFKVVSNKPINSETKSEISKQAKRIQNLSNFNKNEMDIEFQELLLETEKQQILINESKKIPKNSKSRKFANVFNLNK